MLHFWLLMLCLAFGPSAARFVFGPTVEERFEDWLDDEARLGTAWQDDIPEMAKQCPNKIESEVRRGFFGGSVTRYSCKNPALAEVWTTPKIGFFDRIYHGGNPCMRSKNNKKPAGPGQQCCYNVTTLELITSGDYAGTPDRAAPEGLQGIWKHYRVDTAPFNWARRLGRIDEYLKLRPPSQGNGTACVVGTESPK